MRIYIIRCAAVIAAADRSRRRQRDDTSLAAPPHKIRPIRLIGAIRRRGARGARELGRALADFHNVERQHRRRFRPFAHLLENPQRPPFCGLPAPAIIGIIEPSTILIIEPSTILIIEPSTTLIIEPRRP